RPAMLAPARHIPPELWAEIFIHCLPHDDFVVPSERTAPLLLVQICKLWRAIATTTPRLW
ncbi:hypothetical protein PLICRDRAFT_78038, partial [Plicaturopsis crispa FD-325 SS-3]